MELWAAFTIGLVGSLHCVGMCGPIALVLPLKKDNPITMTAQILLYQSGRILTYSLLGALLGFLGKGFILAGLQIYLSIGLGILLIFAALFSSRVEQLIQQVPFIKNLNFWVKVQLSQRMKNQQAGSSFVIGLLNGMLPCGLVYLAIAGAITMSSIPEAMLYMALFGLGTLPLMLITALAGQFVKVNWRNRINKFTPIFLILVGIILLMRGLQFELPLEFSWWQQIQEPPLCH